MEETFGPFHIRARLGLGGFSTVDRALWEPAGREVALKRLLRVDALEMRKRFIQEIKILASLDHPGIVRLLDSGDVDGVLYYAMEIVEGETLADRIVRAVSTGKIVCSISSFKAMSDGLLEALAYLHRERVIHRDLKPSNIFIDRRDRVLLADFGLSRKSELTPITAQGQVFGTVFYLAPEQLAAEPTTEATDVYQAGLVLYEMLAGALPFSELKEPFAVANARRSRPIAPPSQVNPSVPSAVDGVLLRALSIAPEERHANAGELREALAQAFLGVGEKPTVRTRAPATKLRVSPKPAATGGGVQPARVAAVVAVATLLGGAVLWRAVPSRPPASEPAAAKGLQLDVQANEAFVSLRTDGPVRCWFVMDGPQGTRKIAMDSSAGTLHSTWVQDLTPATEYSYSILVVSPGGIEQSSQKERFTTRS